MKLLKPSYVVLVGMSYGLLHSSLCFAQNAEEVSEEAPRVEQESPLEVSIRASEISQPFVSDGRIVHLEDLGLKILPIAGWEVLPHKMGMSLVIQAPESKEIVYDKITFQPNLTVVSMHEAAPIDDVQANKLKEKLKSTIAKAAGVALEDISVDEKHRFFDHQGKNDGLVIYSNFPMRGAQMQQMHVFVSGEQNRFLLTYTDLATEMAKEEVFNRAWAMLSSVEVTGQSPGRYTNLALAGGSLSLFILALVGFSVARRRAAARALDGFDTEAGWDDDMDASEHSMTSMASGISGSWDLVQTKPSSRLP